MLIVGIAGGTGSGKTTVVNKIIERLPKGEVALMPQDSYYKDNSHVPFEERQFINFDHPDAIEFSLLIEQLRQLKNNKLVKQPTYSYLSCERQKETIDIIPKHVVIVEGILVLTHPELRDLMNIKVFVDAEADDRLCRVINRDIIERGRGVAQVLERYEKTLKPMHLQFIEPSKRYADIIIPQGGENDVGINVLVSMIKNHLYQKNML